MLELKILIRQLRGYPENSFAIPQEKSMLFEVPVVPTAGLIIVDLQGNEQGFIELGGEEGVLVK